MERNDIILGLVALVLVVFSLVVALVVPRRNPGFPGRGLRLFAVVAAAIVAGMLATVEVVGGEEERGEEAVAAEPAPAGPAEPAPAEPVPAEPAPAEPAPAEPAGDPAAGGQVFASAGCGACHTLAAAGSSGAIGPNLDDAKPSLELSIDRVTNGQGAMPSFAGQLSEEQIQDVAAYVVASTQG